MIGTSLRCALRASVEAASTSTAAAAGRRLMTWRPRLRRVRVAMTMREFA